MHSEIMRMIRGAPTNFISKSSLHEAGIDVPFYKLNATECKKIDIELSAHVMDTYQRLMHDRFPRRINTVALTNGYGFQKYAIMKGRIPLTEAALAKCVETPSAWRLRISASGVPKVAAHSRRPCSVKTTPPAIALVQVIPNPIEHAEGEILLRDES